MRWPFANSQGGGETNLKPDRPVQSTEHIRGCRCRSSSSLSFSLVALCACRLGRIRFFSIFMWYSASLSVTVNLLPRCPKKKPFRVMVQRHRAKDWQLRLLIPNS
ncbi:hypothetical protein PVAP13_6NG299100 [Panicum virgatum]|uniref:Uncharacterized protein n=1 Tax=Panicum virgatum TaxID=38727 RepID=A0A8T0R391_PANVG|nr:hypothetical protein PVAP13_6NG299100 [Panicum virgatum]